MGIDSRDDLARLVIAVLDRVADTLISRGRATLCTLTTAEGPIVLLDPVNPSAAPLHVAVEYEYLLTCFPGRNGMTYEVFSKTSTEIEDAVASLAQAVVNGEYFERVNDSGSRTKIVASWMKNGQLVNPRNNVLRSPPADAADWRTTRYEPY